jgi:hypothetical protein
MRMLEPGPKPGPVAAEVHSNILHVAPPDQKALSRDVAPWETVPSALAASAASETALSFPPSTGSRSSAASDAAGSIRCHHYYLLEKGSNKEERQHRDHSLI